MKILTYIDDEGEIRAMTEAEFLELDEDGRENTEVEDWVWHIAPNKEAAIERHSEAHDSYNENGHDFFQHEQPPATAGESEQAA